MSKSERRKRAMGEGFGEDEILGGGGRGGFEGFGSGKEGGKKRRKVLAGGDGGIAMAAGEAWEKRKGVLGKRRR